MKKIITSLALVLSFAFVNAQESYTIKMNVKIDGLPPEMAGMADQEMTTYLKGDKSKTEMSGMMGSQTIAFDGKTFYFLNDQMGVKSGYKATKEEMEAGTKKDEPERKTKIVYTADKKMIAGYECTKAIITSEDSDKKQIQNVAWVTDKISSDLNPGKKSGDKRMKAFADLKGFPLEMEMSQSMMGMESKIISTATAISKNPLDDSVFNINTEGYNVTSYKVFMEQMQSMFTGQH